jgi:hypothetical protein
MPRSNKRKRQSLEAAHHSQGRALSPAEPRSMSSPDTAIAALNVDVEASPVTPPPAAVAAGVTPLPPPPPPPPLARDDLLHVIARKLGIPIDHGQVHHNKPIT